MLNCSQLRLTQEIAVVLHQCVCLMLCLQQYRWSRAKSVRVKSLFVQPIISCQSVIDSLLVDAKLLVA